MDARKKTLAIYGIRDTDNKAYPAMIHDHNLTLFHDGKIVNNIQLERLTRNKYDHRLPEFLVDILVQERLLDEADFDLVFVDHMMGRAFQNNRGNIRFEAPMNEFLSELPETGRGYFLNKTIPAYAVNHELAHVFSNLPFYGEFKDSSLHVHFDGGASKSNFSAWLFKDNKMHLLEYHWDLKYLSALFNANALNFSIIGAGPKDQNGMPGKFMGFAAYGTYDPKLERWLKENSFFQAIWKKKTLFFESAKRDWNEDLRSFDQQSTFIQNIAATIQYIFQRDLLEKLSELKSQTGAEYLYYSGGSALNIKANTYLLQNELFKEIYIPPCTNDSGLSVGAGAMAEWLKHGQVDIHSPYLNNWGLKKDDFSFRTSDIQKVVELLWNNKIVGVCNGFGESGPRALGNRSVLALPDSKELASYVSEKLKGREWYRPLAPVMLAKNLSYFVCHPRLSVLSEFMLMDFPVRPERKEELAGVVHVDGTARIQTLDCRKANPFLFDLLAALEKKYNVKALLNTSFNAQGRPIVHTEEDALAEATEMGLDAVVINGHIRTLKS